MNEEYIILEGECPLCTLPWQVKVKKEDLEAYRKGKPIYTCFPYLNDSERELLITGICDECWQTKLHWDDEDI